MAVYLKLPHSHEVYVYGQNNTDTEGSTTKSLQLSFYFSFASSELQTINISQYQSQGRLINLCTTIVH